MTTRTFSGARARFSIEGQKVAYAAGMSGEESVDYEAVDVLDMLAVMEHVPTAYRTSMNANIFRIVGASLKQVGIFPKEADILTTGVMDASVQDAKITGKTAYLFMGVKAATRSFDVSARGLVTENLSFVAIRVQDEAEVASV